MSRPVIFTMRFLQVERACMNHTIKTKREKFLNRMKQKDQIHGVGLQLMVQEHDDDRFR
jgi:hypothetical protein